MCKYEVSSQQFIYIYTPLSLMANMCAGFICAGFIISLHQWRLPSFQTHDILYVGHCTLNRSKVITGTLIFAKSPRHHCRKSTNVSLTIAFKTLPPHGWSQCLGGWQGHCPVTERSVPRIFCWDDILYVGHCTLNCSKVITGTPIFAKSP